MWNEITTKHLVTVLFGSVFIFIGLVLIYIGKKLLITVLTWNRENQTVNTSEHKYIYTDDYLDMNNPPYLLMKYINI